jgi:Cys-rich protein (TIGR01571 family)
LLRVAVLAHGGAQSLTMVTWSSGLCACFSDCDSCWTVFCIPCVALGQLSQKVLGYSCVVVTMFFLCVYALSYTFEIYANLPYYDVDRNPIACYVSHHDGGETCLPHPFVIAFCFIAFCAACIFTTILRNAIRRRDKIKQDRQCCADSCGIKDGEDCCCAFWCGPCSICQMMRHEGLTGSNYTIMAQAGLKEYPQKPYPQNAIPAEAIPAEAIPAEAIQSPV